MNPVSLPEDSLETIQSVQSDLLQVTYCSFFILFGILTLADDQIALVQAMSQLFHLGEKMDDHGSLKADIAALTYQLREEKDNILA